MRRLFALLILVTAVVVAPTPARADGDHSTKVMVLVDSSASMFEHTGGGVTRMEATRRGLGAAVSTLGKLEEVGVQVYGSGASADPCQDSKVLVEPKAGNRKQLDAALALKPTHGQSPIGPALKQAKEKLGDKGPRAIILVAHAAPSCGPDPVEVAAKIVRDDPEIRVHVVGVDVDGTDRRLLIGAANAGGGVYRDARGADQLATSLGAALDRAITIYLGGGGAVEGGASRASATPVRSGTWFDTVPAGGERWFTFERALASSTLHLHASADLREDPSDPARKDSLEIKTYTGGRSCGSGKDSGVTGADAILTAYVPVPDLASTTRTCLSAPKVTFMVRRAAGSDPLPVEIYAAEEAPAPDEPLKPVAVQGELPPLDLSAPAGAPQIGAPAFSLAAQVQPGAHPGSIVPGETQIFRVPVGWGQRLNVAASFSSATTPMTAPMTATISVISPNRADVVDQTSLAVAAGRDAVLNSGTQQVAYGNRGAGERHLAATNVAGDYYLVVSLEAAEGAARVDVPYVFGVEAVGSEQHRPEYRGEMVEAPPAPPAPTATAARSEKSGPPWWIAVLACLAGLGVGAAAWRFTRA